MNHRLRYLPLPEVAEGMMLGTQLVLADHGVIRFSLPAGHALTEANLRQLAVHQAEFVCIQEEDKRSDAEREREWAVQEQRLAHIFRAADMGEPAVAGLYQAVLAYRRS